MTVATTPELAALQDLGEMKRVFARYLQPADGAALQIHACRLDYMRQSNSRLVLQYTLQLAHPETGETKLQIVSGATYGRDRAGMLLARLHRSDPASLHPLGPFSLPPVSYVPELDLMLQVFPYDHRLPGLLRLFQGTDDLATPLLAEFGPGDWRVTRWETESVRYRPDMRAMVRLDVEGREAGSGQIGRQLVYAKVYRDAEEGRQAWHRLRILDEGTRHADLGFVVARPIAFVDRWQVLLLGEVPGTRLLHIVRRANEGEAIAAVRRGARAVAGLHQFPFPAGVLPDGTRDREMLLAGFAERLGTTSPEDAPEVKHLADAIAAKLVESPLAPTHFDLKQGHLLLADERVTLLDFDKLALGDPLIDVANLVATLSAEREASERRGERRSALTEAFLAEYFARVPASWREQFPARLAMATLAEAATTGRGQRGRTGRAKPKERAAAAVARARGILAGELW